VLLAPLTDADVIFPPYHRGLTEARLSPSHWHFTNRTPRGRERHPPAGGVVMILLKDLVLIHLH
jgi:hypothetical protein